MLDRALKNTRPSASQLRDELGRDRCRVAGKRQVLDHAAIYELVSTVDVLRAVAQ
jgi:hypothetical protein